MAWPEPTEYHEAIQTPQLCFGDAELRQGQPVTSPLGLPVVCAGNFALVYQINGAGQSWAVKCFTRAAPARQQRYQGISAHLRRAALPFMVDFRYLEEGIRVGGQWFPVVKMRWVEGLTLNALLREHVDRPQVLQRLAQMWLPLAQKLRAAGIAHADLQHGNVLLVPKQKAATFDLRLIDYDGMFVPALADVPSGEVGHPAYQHPQRLRDGTCNADVDRFAQLVIYTALRCLVVGGRALWERHDNTENLLFREQDFKEPDASKLFEELWRLDDADTRALVGHLLLASQDALDRVPPLEELVDGGQVLPLTPRGEKRVRELLPAGTQAGPVPVALAPVQLAPVELAPVELAPVALAPPTKEMADGDKTIPLAPLAPNPVPVAARHTDVKRTGLSRKTARPRALATATEPRPRWLLAGAFAGGGVLLAALIVLAIVALTGGGDNTPQPGPGEGPGPQPLPATQALAPSLKLAPVAAVALKAGERTNLPIHLTAQGIDAPVEVHVDGLPVRVRQEQPLALLPGQTDGVLALRAELGAAAGMQEIRVVARGKGLESGQAVPLTVAPQTAVALAPPDPVRLKPGDVSTVPLRLSAAGHDVPLDVVVEGLPEMVRRVGKVVPFAPGKSETTVALLAISGAPPATHQLRVCLLANGAKVAEQPLEVRVETAGALVLQAFGGATIKAGEHLGVPVTVRREGGAAGAVRVEAAPVAGVRVVPVTVPADTVNTVVMVIADKDAAGPVTLTLVARLGSLETTLPLQVVIARRPHAVAHAVQFRSVDDVELHGTFYPGVNGRKAPCVLLLHAYKEDSRAQGWTTLAAELQQAGFAVLSFDFRGHGQSTKVGPLFWRHSANANYTRNTRAAKQKDTIDARYFVTAYQAVLANDIAAARTFLEQHSATGQCDAANLTLIGAWDGATVGAVWLNAEWHRYRMVRTELKTSLAPLPEGRNITGAVWLSMRGALGSRTVSLPGILDVPARQHDVPMAFVYAAGDAQGKAAATQCFKALAKKKAALTGVKAFPGVAVGSNLLAASPETVRWVVDYVRQASEQRGGNEPVMPGRLDAFYWRLPRSMLPAQALGERMVRFETFQHFLR